MKEMRMEEIFLAMFFPSPKGNKAKSLKQKVNKKN